jgi:hypothetical protein
MRDVIETVFIQVGSMISVECYMLLNETMDMKIFYIKT